MTTIDNLVGDDDIPPTDFINIDVEGYELQALAGAKQTILKHRPAVSVEVNPISDLPLFDEWMDGVGYARTSEKLNYTATFIYEAR